MKMKSLKNIRESPIFSSFMITTFGSGLSKVILVFTTFYCTNMLTKAEFGGFSFIRNTLNTILVICALNYVGLCVKFTAEAKYHERSSKWLILLFGFSLALCLLVGTVLLVLPDCMMLSILGDEGLIRYFRLLGLFLPVFMVQPLLEGVFRGLKKFKLISYMQVGTSLAFFAFVAGGIYIKGYEGAVYGMLLYYLIYAVVSLIYALKLTNVRKFISNNITGIWSEASVIWNMILPMFLLSFVEAPINWWAQVLLTKHDSLSAVGSMTAILQIRNLTTLIPNYFFSSFFAFAATYNAEGKYSEYFSKYKRLSVMFFLVSCVALLIYTLFDTFILGLYGENYKTDTIPFLISNLSIPLMIVSSFLRGNLMVMEHQKVMLFMSIVASLFFIFVLYGGLISGMPGVNAYFWGQFVQYAIMFGISFYVIKKDKSRLLR